MHNTRRGLSFRADRSLCYPYTMIPAVLFVLFAYLLGSIPVGVILAKLRGRDPRTAGSGNIGATNVMRTAGKALGIATLVGDTLKGVVPVALALHWGLPEHVTAAAGFAAFAGHLFPIYLKFKGGKGVATALGVFLTLAPTAILIAAVFFFASLLKWRYVSLGSLVGMGLIPFILFALRAPTAYALLSIPVALLVFWKHKENIRRLMAGKENKLWGKRVKGV